MSSAVQETTFRGLPAYHLRCGATEVTVSRFGAQVLSWWRPDTGDLLYLSPSAIFDGRRPIRGGIPVCFPQFSDRGPLPAHGFARVQMWDPLRTDTTADAAVLVLRLSDTCSTRARWPHSFEIFTTVTCTPGTLEVALHLTVPAREPLDITCGLHTYLRVAGPAPHLAGLIHQRYTDAASASPFEVHRDLEPTLPAVRPVDRIYTDAPPVVLTRSDRRLRIRSTGFPETIVWNPGPEGAQRSTDLPRKAWRDLVCIEAAATTPVRIDRDHPWRGSQSITVEQRPARP